MSLEGNGGGVTLGKQKTKDMSKTIKEWLMELPEGYREAALDNFEKSGYGVFGCECMEEAIFISIDWGSLDWDGHYFWEGVGNHYFKGTPLPPLPPPPPRIPSITTISAKTNAQIFDEVANNVMAEYDPAGFRKKFKTLHKAIIIAMEKAAKQHKNA